MAGSPNPLTSPANGIVTQWAIVTTDNVVFGLRILRPTGPGTYVGAGTAVAPTQDPNGPDNRLVLRYPASLPISQGDAIGVYATGGDSDVGVPQHNTPGVGSNIWATNPLGTPADGASASFTPESGHELLLQATIRFCNVPNVVGQTEAAAAAAIAAADCTSTATTQKLRLKAVKKSFSKKKRKEDQGQEQETEGPERARSQPGHRAGNDVRAARTGCRSQGRRRRQAKEEEEEEE